MSAVAVFARRRGRISLPLLIGAGIVLIWIVIGLFPGLFAPYDPDAFDYDALLQAPGLAHPFGTDSFGRDILSRVIWAARLDIQIAVFSTIFALGFGTILGALCGFYGGWFDAIVSRVIDVVVIFPFLVLIIAIIAVLGPGLFNMYVALAAINWVSYCKLMRGEIRLQRQLDYASAARVLGYRDMRILFRHLVPNAMTPIVVFWMTDMALAVLLGSSLGYLGLGAQPPEAEWGVLIADGKNYIETAWWMSVWPGAAIITLGFGLSLLGDGLVVYFGKKERS